MSTERIVNCPACGTQVVWGPQSPFRPFCSNRCKLVDLGAWATEQYRVPTTDSGNDETAGDSTGAGGAIPGRPPEVN